MVMFLMLTVHCLFQYVLWITVSSVERLFKTYFLFFFLLSQPLIVALLRFVVTNCRGGRRGML